MKIEIIADFVSYIWNTKQFSDFFVRLTLRKVEIDGVSGPRREFDIRYEFYLKIILKVLGRNSKSSSCFWLDFQATVNFVIVSVRLILSLGLSNLQGHEGKVTPDKKIISLPRYQGGNKDYCSNFSVTLETTSKFPIVFVWLILGKVGFN